MLTFVGFTRTQVGRDGLRKQFEQQFNHAFKGNLEIGQLTGNLAQDLFAADVRLYDPTGREVLRVDSLVARPSWRDLFRKRVSVRSLTLIRPTFYLRYQADSTWNLADAFHKSDPKAADAAAEPWSFNSADLHIIDGAVHTQHETVVPLEVEQGWLFNYANANAQEIQARATIEWSTEGKLIDVLSFSASLPDVSFAIDDLQGQLVIEPGRILVNQGTLQAGRTDLHFDGTVENLDSLRTGALDAFALDGTLHASRFDADQWRRLLPRLPLADVVTASARIQGPLNQLVISEATAQRGQTRIAVEGTILGLPDSLDFEMAARNSTVAAADLQAVLPDVSWPDLAHLGPVSIDAIVEGVARGASGRRSLRADAEIDARGAMGHLDGTLALRQQPGQAARYRFDLRTDSLDVGRLQNDSRLASTLNGRLTIEGSGFALDSLNTSIQAALLPSRFAGRRVDSVHVDASVAGRRLEATAFARRDREGVFANAVLNWNTRLPSYDLGLITRRLDLGPLLAADSLRSSLNMQWTLEGAGLSWADARGTLTMTFDSSEVHWGTTSRPLPPHQSVLTLHDPAGDEPRLLVTGDAVALRLDGRPSMDEMQTLTALWSYAMSQAWDRQQEKTYRREAPDAALIDGPSLDQILLQENARQALQAAGHDSLTLDLTLDVHRSDVLTALLPMLPAPEADLNARLRVVADADRLRLDGTANGDSLRLNAFDVAAYKADFETSMDLDEPLEQSLIVAFDARADSLRLARQAFGTPRLAADFRNQTGHASLTTDRSGNTGPVRLNTTFDLLPDRHRLTLQEFYFALGDYVWQNPNRAAIDFFADATVIDGLRLESQSSNGGATQRVQVRGALSDAPEDTFFVDVEAIGLRQLSDFLAMKRSLGGRLDGQIALTGTDQRILIGTLSVDALALDDRLLGRLEAATSYLPGTPDVALDSLVLRPMEPDDPLPPGMRPDLRVTENRARMTGTFRLPKSADDDPGSLNLRVIPERVDGFFFEYIVKELANVEGAITGEGTITGSLEHPIFDADLTMADGRFDVPKFNLHFEDVEGPVRVDEEGIKFDGVTLRDKTNGTATTSGAIFFNDYRFISFDVNARLDELQIIDVPSFTRELPFYGRIWASGDATLTGPLDNVVLRAPTAVTRDDSEIFIPITAAAALVDPGFIIFADSTGAVPDVPELARRENILDKRPVGERTFTEGMEIDLNILAPEGSTVRLVIDPLLGDVINAVGSGRIQLQRREGEFFTFGTLQVDSGDYLFTAGEVFVRRFLINQGTITWNGDPLNPRLDIEAAYQTRASKAGLPEEFTGRLQPTIPLIVQLFITGELNGVQVDLNLALDRSRQETISDTPLLEAYLNQPDRAAEHASSVLLTNSFLLTTEGTDNNVLAGSAFNSVSALVSSQLNRYLSQVIPNADFTFGVQSDEEAQDLDVSAGVAIRLLNERLVIRGQGLYRAVDNVDDTAQQGLQGEFVVEIRLNPSVSVEVFYRREGDVLSESLLTSETGAGLSYQTQFSTWRRLFQRIFGGGNKPDVASDSTNTVVDARDG